MQRFLAGWTISILLSSLCCPYDGWAEALGMVTGSKTGTYIRFGQDIAGAAKQLGLEIEIKESEGSIDNIRRLTSAENAAFAIVQSDVMGYLSRSEEPQMRRIASQLRLIFPFYNEEIHLLARQDIQRFEDLNWEACCGRSYKKRHVAHRYQSLRSAKYKTGRTARTKTGGRRQRRVNRKS